LRKNGISATKTLEILSNAFVDNAISKPQSWNGTEVSKPARTPLKMMLVSDVQNIGFWWQRRNNKRNGHIKSLEELAEEISISHGSCQAILCNHLKMRHIAAKVVPKLLTFEQKSIRQSISKDMVSRVNSDDTFLKRIITEDETWVYGYDIETKKCQANGSSPVNLDPRKRGNACLM